MTTSDAGGTDVLRRLADRFDRAEVTYEAGVWTVTWTDGLPVAQMRQAAEEAAPEAAGRLAYRRVLSQEAVALGAVRLATGPDPGAGGRRRISPEAVEGFWREVPLPSPDFQDGVMADTGDQRKAASPVSALPTTREWTSLVPS
ncbi:hypothetical protein [Streptomyces vilmorinianum]|uniref:hypothetical protein n=1 Tax=Streptomyces vilmorinianum TaxID=3051092 RepID=UPI0010FAD479|nr:hypothetical protein [Streptomyces vilmorinianum]